MCGEAGYRASPTTFDFAHKPTKYVVLSSLSFWGANTRFFSAEQVPPQQVASTAEGKEHERCPARTDKTTRKL